MKAVNHSNNYLATISNDLVRASYRLSLNEIRLLLVAISQMPKSIKGEDGTYNDVVIDPQQPYYITKKDFISLGVSPKNVVKEILSACDDLMSRTVTINTPIGDYDFHWVSNVFHFKTDRFKELQQKFPNSKYDDDFIESLKFHELLDSLQFIDESDENVVARVVFSPDIIKYISQLKEQFTKLNLEEFTGFSSFYSFRIYMLMLSWQKVGSVTIKLTDFKKMLDLTDKYSSVQNLKKRVLDLAIKEISEKSPYYADYSLTDKEGRSGKGIKATILRINFTAKSKAIEGEAKNREDANDYRLTEPQLDTFSNILAHDKRLESYCKAGSSYSEFAAQIKQELKTSLEKRLFYKPYLIDNGFKIH